MEESFTLIVSTISMLAAVFTAIMAFFAAKSYMFKETYYGKSAEDELLRLELNIDAFESKPYEGGNNRKFPSLRIEKKWGRLYKVTYYVEEGSKKQEKTWYKKRG